MQIIESQQPHWPDMALLNLGFRPFFLGAAFFGAFTLVTWLYHYTGILNLYPVATLPASLWHAHEMIFGYTAAVIAGFLLTATKNWTAQQTPHQLHLGLLFMCWLLPRVFLIFDVIPVWISAFLDIAFNGWLFVAVSKPIISSAAKKQFPILGKIIFLAVCNSLFYSQALGLTENTAALALYLALFVVLGLILMMTRRLIPFFIESGVGQLAVIKNNTIVDSLCLLFFLAFLISELFLQQPLIASVSAGLLAVTLSIRAFWWHHPGIWRRPLLWSLYIAYCAIIIGFGCYAMLSFGWMPKLLALHILTIGGIGLMTVSMMARVSLGHTGRDIHTPPAVISAAFLTLILCMLVRIIGPLLFPEDYIDTVLVSGGLWIVAMLIFACRYLPILWRNRVDNNYG